MHRVQLLTLLAPLLLLMPAVAADGSWLQNVFDFCTKDNAHEALCDGIVFAAGGATTIALKKLLATGCCGTVDDNVPAEEQGLLENAQYLQEDYMVRDERRSNIVPLHTS